MPRVPPTTWTLPTEAASYKVWVTPVEDFVGDANQVDNDCGNGCFHGFVPSKSKTDNFKAKVGASSFCVTVWKRLVVDGEESPGAEWPIVLRDSLGVENQYFTGEDGFLQACGLTEDDYTVREDNPDDYTVIGLTVNGVKQSAQPMYSFHWSQGQPEPVIIFKNEFGSGPPPMPQD